LPHQRRRRRRCKVKTQEIKDARTASAEASMKNLGIRKPDRQGGQVAKGDPIVKPIFVMALVIFCALSVFAQQPAEQRAGLNEAPTALDAKGTAALEGRLLTT